MKKVLYLASVDMCDGSAQAGQIADMCRLYKNLLPEDFFAFAFSSQANNKFSQFCKLFSLLDSKLLRSLIVARYVFFKYSGSYGVITREILFAFIFSVLGKKVVLECHDETSKLNKNLIRLMGIFSKPKVVSVTQALADSHHIPFPKGRVFVHPNGVSDDYFDVVSGLKKNPPIFFEGKNKVAVYTGALHKGDDIDSLSSLFEFYPGWDFLFIGGSEEQVRKFKIKYKDFNNVFFLGRKSRKEVVAYQVHADVLLYPLTKKNKLWEYTSPLKLFEYMASGTPIVACCIGSIEEFLNKELAFLYFNEYKPRKAFEEFLNSPPEMINSMSEKAVFHVKKNFSRNVRAKNILNLIK